VIQLYNYDLTSSQLIASLVDPAGWWTALGYSPGISDDGKIVTFFGNLTAAGATALKTTAGPGIFASIDEGGALRTIVRVAGWTVEDMSVGNIGNRDGICDTSEVCIPTSAEDMDDPSGNHDGFCDAGEVCLQDASANIAARPGANLDGLCDLSEVCFEDLTSVGNHDEICNFGEDCFEHIGKNIVGRIWYCPSITLMRLFK
jgi:hypothetical protein